MPKYRVRYWVEYEVIVHANSEKEAEDAAFAIDPNQWSQDCDSSLVVEEVEEDYV